MHFSAKRGLAITYVVRPSVRPSVCNVVGLDCDHIGWNSSEIIPPLVSLGWSLSADPNIRGSTSRGTPWNFGPKWPTPGIPVDLSVGDIRSQIAVVTDSATVTMEREPIENHHRSFEWCHRWPPTTSPSHQMGVPYAPKIREWSYLRNGWSDTVIHFMFGSRVGFSRSADRMALFPVTTNPSWRQAAILDNFEWPYLHNGSFRHSIHLYSEHRAVIFAIAQLSCLFLLLVGSYYVTLLLDL